MIEKKKNNLGIPESQKPRIVIIGGGFGGLNFLKKLDEKYFQVVLLDRYNYHTFQPLLYQVATAGLEPDSVAGPLRKILNRKRNIYFRMVKVEKVEIESKTIQTTAGKLAFDHLILATGSKINFFHNENIARHSLPLKQVTHALDLRSHIFQKFERLEMESDPGKISTGMNFIIVGAGPTGVELCGALAELKNHVLPKDYPGLDFSQMKIHLVEGLKRVLPGMSKKSGNMAHKYLEKMGVDITLECLTDDYDGETVKLSNGREIKAGTLIWAAGVKANIVEGFSDKSIEKEKLLVNGFNNVYQDADKQKVYDNIYAIGDLAFMKTEKYPEGLPGLAQPAIQQGKQLAKNFNRAAKNKEKKEFHYRNKGVLATIGRNKAVADFSGRMHLKGFIGWFVWMLVHLLFLVGFRNKAVVFANWVWNYFTYDKGIRLILRPSTKIKDSLSSAMGEEMSEQ